MNATEPLGVYKFWDPSQPKNAAYMPNTTIRNTAEKRSGKRELRKLNMMLLVTA